ncbi:DUF6483 family protein [Oceanirhabdus seepicola]|uniref:Uncharacterized protein n=1 Tax=Oceanirhabdus seepicola TaxID=2828781 RepID=A0A9J6P871_9CLOT|nr:DUF6483 family protein [Oceanirhabdus seepicola]MCM1992105.1 hypothetical protein [Oceanirhabdus seepicola]
MIKNDYILDLVESFGKTIGKVVSEVKEDPEPIIIENLSDKDMTMIILKKMLYGKKFNEAENRLFKYAETNNCDKILEIGEWFYTELSHRSDTELLENNFNRNEIEQGLNDFMRCFNSQS